MRYGEQKMSKSFFLYIHQSLCNTPGAWKIGKGMTPYSVCRARQKFQWKKFSLDYLYWGRPEHIDTLESLIKDSLNQYSGTVLNDMAAQTELFMLDIDKIRENIDKIIQNKCLDAEVVELQEPYSASKSSDCPLGIPGESISHIDLSERVSYRWGPNAKENYKICRNPKPTGNIFSSLFSLD